MTHKLILKVRKFQLSSAKRFGTVEEKPPGGGFHPQPFRVKGAVFQCFYFVSMVRILPKVRDNRQRYSESSQRKHHCYQRCHSP